MKGWVASAPKGLGLNSVWIRLPNVLPPSTAPSYPLLGFPLVPYSVRNEGYRYPQPIYSSYHRAVQAGLKIDDREIFPFRVHPQTQSCIRESAYTIPRC